VAMGTAKWFNPTKGYGFIKPDGDGTDVFVHISAVEKAGYTQPGRGCQGQLRAIYGPLRQIICRELAPRLRWASADNYRRRSHRKRSAGRLARHARRLGRD
jgi:cold shock protein